MWKIAGIGLLLLAGQAYGSEASAARQHQAVTGAARVRQSASKRRKRVQGWSKP